MTKGYYEVQETRTMQNDYFVFYRKRFQRKTGGCKNRWVVVIRSRTDNIERIPDMLRTMEDFGGKDFGLLSRIFNKRKDAEKAWVWLNVGHS